MNCTFYRPEKLLFEECENIVGKLAYDLYLLENDKCKRYEVEDYVDKLLSMVKTVEHNDKMGFLGFGDPEKLRTEERILLIYRPTYLATAFIIKAFMLYPDMVCEKREKNLALLLMGCSGRGFRGFNGFYPGEPAYTTKECIELFERIGTEEFLKKQ